MDSWKGPGVRLSGVMKRKTECELQVSNNGEGGLSG